MGLKTRYDGQVFTSRPCNIVIDDGIWLPVCPEQLGGLSTPREAADLVGGDGADVLKGKARVITRSGEDVTESFCLGARQVLQIALQQNIRGIFLKSGSPSCGITPQIGVTAALLSQQKRFYIREFE
jgi:uncharacterized protein YbbK (DUF523 family)